MIFVPSVSILGAEPVKFAEHVRFIFNSVFKGESAILEMCSHFLQNLLIGIISNSLPVYN